MSMCRVKATEGLRFNKCVKADDMLSTNGSYNLLALAQPDTCTGKTHMYVNTSKTTHCMKYIKGSQIYPQAAAFVCETPVQISKTYRELATGPNHHMPLPAAEN